MKGVTDLARTVMGLRSAMKISVFLFEKKSLLS